MPSGSEADQRGTDAATQRSGRRLRLESIRILAPQYVTLTDEQEVRAVAMLSELLMPLLRGRLLAAANSCEASSSDEPSAQ